MIGSDNTFWMRLASFSRSFLFAPVFLRRWVFEQRTTKRKIHLDTLRKELATVFNGGKTSEASEISFNNVWAVAIDRSNNSRSPPIRIITGVFPCCKLRCSIMISGSAQTAEYEWAKGRCAKRKRFLVTVPSVCKFVPLKMFPQRISEPCMARSMTKAGTRFAMKTRAH